MRATFVEPGPIAPKRLLAAFAFSAALIAAPSGAAPKGDPCADAQIRAMLPGSSCVAARHGFALAPPTEAPVLAKVIDESHARFGAHFLERDRAFAVIGSTNVPLESMEALKARGYAVMPWLTAENKAKLRARNMKSVEDQIAALPADKREAAMAQVREKLGLAKPGTVDQKEAGVLAHELAHLRFKAWFDDGRAPPPAKRYGSTAPDWLDEMAAVLAENETLTRSRWDAMPAHVAAGEVRPLRDYLKMDHPMLEQAMASVPPGSGVRMVVLSGEAAEKRLAMSKGAAAFYAQSRAFADFMIERSGEQRVFLSIGTALRDGRTFEQWLASDGRKHRLPATLAELQTQWDGWLAAKLA